MFNTFFTKVFSNPDSCRVGVLKLLLNVKENKATGPNSLLCDLLKLSAHEIADIYILLFQASLDQGHLPKGQTSYLSLRRAIEAEWIIKNPYT